MVQQQSPEPKQKPHQQQKHVDSSVYKRQISNSSGDNNNNNNDDPNFDRKLDLITAGGKPFIKQHLLTRITKENCLVIINYILALQTEVSPADTYRIDNIFKLKQLAEFHNPI